MKKTILIWLIICVQDAQSFEFPEVSELWLREAPPNAKMLAAYATVKNQSQQNLKLVSAYAPDFGMAEIHKTIEVNGMLKMQEQKLLDLDAGSEIIMKPGGIHIMLMMPKEKFKAGDEARICLIYQDNEGEEHVQHLDFPVKKQ